MGLSHGRRHVPAPEEGGADGRFDVIGEDGKVVSYLPDDFDEIFTTTDEREAGRHVTLGWLLLDEVVRKGHGPDRTEFVERPESTGGMGGLAVRTVAVNVGPDRETLYVLGYLKADRRGNWGEASDSPPAEA